MATDSNIVVDDGRAKWSDLWLKEDYWAIWIGFFIIIVTGLIMMNGRADIEAKINKYNTIIAAEKAKPIKTIELLDAQAAKKGVTGAKLPAAKTIISYLGKPGKWSGNPMNSFISHKKADKVPAYDAAKAATKDAKAAAKLAQDAAAAANFENADLNKAAEGAIAKWQKAKKAEDKAKKAVGSDKNIIPGLVVLCLGLGVITGLGMVVMGYNFVSYFVGFVGVFALACLANVLGGYKPTAAYGVNGEIMAIVTGMVIANTIGTPKWIKPAVQVEYYIKAGLVLLGAEVLFNKILAIGIPGIFVAWVVTPIVLCGTYIFGQKVLKMPSKTLNITISADMSVCGTSAAIAVAAACRAKKEELTLSVGLSMVFTAIMMVAMPAFIKLVGLPEVLGGAWIGGTVDSTGAVAAAAQLHLPAVDAHRRAELRSHQQGAFADPAQAGPGGRGLVGEGGGHGLPAPGGMVAVHGKAAPARLFQQGGGSVAHFVQTAVVVAVGVRIGRRGANGDLVNDLRRQGNGGHYGSFVSVGGQAGHVAEAHQVSAHT